ncbi:hypothetical protein [Candidatus Formimonas warabiya]|uniref:Uncharacterized protein n=1 Tax=Formimonas warabiya TaxID=1761012 RepID=A0A3G1KQ77_FORW1|nr:hypothetical protein [Candidatus Formimonas warabiya]ATW24586.1 hypothetical protein DCMF_07120 [Candidatus Formimonas warabiya]
MKMTLLELLFQGIPEQISLVLLTFLISKAKVDWKRIVVMGIFMACFIYLIRLLPITFGVHTIIAIALLIFIMVYLEKISLVRSVISVILVYVFLIFAETICFRMISTLFQLSWDQIRNNEILMIISGIPQVILMLFVAFITNKISLR